MKKSFKFLPKSLFMRMILMIVLPLVLVQCVVVLIFYGNLWDIVLRRLSRGVAVEASIVVRHHLYFRVNKDRDWSIETAREETGYDIIFVPHGTIPKAKPIPRFEYSPLEKNLRKQLKESLLQEFYLNVKGNNGLVIIDVQVDDGYIEFRVPISRLYTSSSWLVLVWMAGSSLIFLTISGFFLRNQIRPIRNLAKAARQFGEDKPDELLVEAGSSEIRDAMRAFMEMRQVIRRTVKQRTAMLSAASHDLRTPLTRMKLNIELLDLGSVGEGLKQDIADMERLISSYLDFLRGAGDGPLSTVNINEFMAEIRQNAVRSGLQLVDLSETTSRPNSLANPQTARDTMQVQKLALKRVFENLISNSVRHATHVSLSYQWVENKLVIYFDDDGTGIPASMRHHAFEPFARLETSRNQDTGGYGLGLALVKNVIEEHHGQVSLHDSPLGGLRVEISLPQKR